MQIINKQLLFIAGMLLLLADLATAGEKFTPQSQPTGWLATPEVTLFDLASGEEVFFQLGFFKDTWSGNVHALDVNNIARIQPTGPWDENNPTLTTAGSLLDSADYNTDRIIFTLGSPFRYEDLKANTSVKDAHKKLGDKVEIVNFIRGDRSNEEPNGQSFRLRESVLGDILHSNIHYWDDGTTQTLFVGANDGMLHAFDANTGVENWAYIPSILIVNDNFKDWTKKPYVHKHFVDGPISIANIDYSGTLKTILVGGLGAGGAGLYALDITSTTVANELDGPGKVMWEISGSADPYKDILGYTYGTPVFTRLADGTAAVIIGNGYISRLGVAVLFVINANTGALISAIDTLTGNDKQPNGLSSPTLYDVDSDGKHEYAYAGDMDGQLWKFDLNNNTKSLLFTTNPVQPITTAPVVQAHPLGGQMIAFATGRMLTSGDKVDSSTHYVYGIWDGAPAENDQLLTQTFTDTTFGADVIPVRSITGNLPDWSAGTGHHYGWKVALAAPGERVVGEKPLYNNGRFYFLTTNPIAERGENWLHELVLNTGGEPLATIFDLNEDGKYNTDDHGDNDEIIVGKYLGPGIFSQPRLVQAEGLTTTLYVFHPDIPIVAGVPTPPVDPGISAGHFDFDIYYYGPASVTTINVPTGEIAIPEPVICKKSNDVSKVLESETDLCKKNTPLEAYPYLSDYITSSVCKADANPDKVEYYHTLQCKKVVAQEVSSADYLKKKHVHEYDDKYDVTGVNMLNASLPDFNLVNALPDPTTPFKTLVMNQYLNPAVFLNVGPGSELSPYESVKTYGSLATQTNPATLLTGLPVYTRADIGTFTYALPLDAFKNKDWWGDGGVVRAGLIPTQTGCVNGVDNDGVVATPGLLGERFNGAITFQLIKPDTLAEHLEFNGPDVTYGWRVKAEYFTQQVLVEYTSFWHHPNGACYGDDDWVADAPEDFGAKVGVNPGAAGSDDPREGAFGVGVPGADTGGIVISEVINADGTTTTITTITYDDGTTFIKEETERDDGTVEIYIKYRDDTEETIIAYDGRGGKAGFIDPNTGSPEEDLSTGVTGRQSWRDTRDDG